MVGWGTVQRGHPDFCPQGMSAPGFDLVHEVEMENSLEGSPTTKHLSLDIEPPLKEFYLNQWSEPRRG